MNKPGKFQQVIVNAHIFTSIFFLCGPTQPQNCHYFALNFWYPRRHLESLRANRCSCDNDPIVARKVARKCETLRLNSLRDVRSILRRKQCLSSLWTGLWLTYGEGKAKRPVDKHLGPPFHGTRCASDPDANSYCQEHWLLTGLIDIGFSVGT